MTETTPGTEVPQKGPLELLNEEWLAESRIDRSQLSKESAEVPYLHGKYLQKATRWAAISRKLKFEIDELYKVKFEYYSGHMSKEELDRRGWKQSNFLLKGEVKNYVEADEDMMKLKRKKAVYDQLVETCVQILDQINRRSFHIANIIANEKLERGIV